VRAETISDLVIDGANRLGPSSSWGAALFFAIAALAAVAMVRRESRLSMPAVIVLALLGALPGFSACAAHRADAPWRVHAAADRVERLTASLESYAHTHGCAAVVRSTCAACDPIVRFAMATTAPCASPAPIVLHENALDAECAEAGGALVCGGPGAR
jgi:hypothetical protein